MIIPSPDLPGRGVGLFHDHCHYTDRANELLAEALAVELEQLSISGIGGRG